MSDDQGGKAEEPNADEEEELKRRRQRMRIREDKER
jgi:hypothetical protein